MNFVIKICESQACNNWRLNNQCAKDGMSIAPMIRFAANIHDNDTCQVRQQINTYRLHSMLED